MFALAGYFFTVRWTNRPKSPCAFRPMQLFLSSFRSFILYFFVFWPFFYSFKLNYWNYSRLSNLIYLQNIKRSNEIFYISWKAIRIKLCCIRMECAFENGIFSLYIILEYCTRTRVISEMCTQNSSFNRNCQSNEFAISCEKVKMPSKMKRKFCILLPQM